MKENDKKTVQYLKRLEAGKKEINFFDCTKSALEKNQVFTKEDETLFKTTVCVTAPVFIAYVTWVLKLAQKSEVKKLFFLARDAKIFYEIACYLCRINQIDIECRYLYCSRYSLRLPMYYLDKEYAIETLFVGGSKTSVNVILNRFGMEEKEKDALCKELGIDINERSELINNVGIHLLKERLFKSQMFLKMLEEKSLDSYNNSIGYFIQEGLLEETRVCLVDSGWTGSIQKCLGKILHSVKPDIEIKGYYFGLERIREKENGIYESFFFSPYKNFFRINKFNYNIFEALCAVNHGMTLGYKMDKDVYKPVLKEFTYREYIEKQTKVIMKYAEDLKIDLKYVDEKSLDGVISENILSFIMRPSKNEADFYGQIEFCEDFSESYEIKLAAECTKKELRRYFLPVRIYDRLLSKSTKRQLSESLWIEAAIVNLKPIEREWIRLNKNAFNRIRDIKILKKAWIDKVSIRSKK